MKKIEVIVYRQGSNWVSNIDGYLTQLHYSVKTKEDVKKHFAEKSEEDFVEYILIFA